MNKKEALRKELIRSELQYRLYRISYFGVLVGGVNFTLVLYLFCYSGKLDFDTFTKLLFMLFIIILFCGVYFLYYTNKLDKWYKEYKKQRDEEERLKTIQDIEDGKYLNLKISKTP